MVQKKKFEQTFVNEYLAWNLHDQDVRKKGFEDGVIQTAKKLLSLGLSLKTIEEGTGLSEEEIIKLR